MRLDEALYELKKNIKITPDNAVTYKCSKCKDTGWISFVDKMGRSYTKHCECWKVRQSEVLMKSSGISLEFQNKSFENFDTKNKKQLIVAKNKAVGYFQNFKKTERARNNSIMFYGQVGSGKTHLGTAICSSLMTENIVVIYMAYRNAVTKIKQLLINEAEYSREINKYSQARVLYIDDFLKGKITEADVNILYEIINYRYMNNLPIIISTEKNLNELLAFDEAIGSRIIEMCRGNIVQLQGKDLNYRLYS